MKLIVALIRPEKFSAVRDALSGSDVHLMTTSQVYGCGMQKGREAVYLGGSTSIEFLPKTKLEIAVNEEFVEQTVNAIVLNARTGNDGQIGDGKIFILPLEQCVRIRTGEKGPVAIGP